MPRFLPRSSASLPLVPEMVISSSVTLHSSYSTDPPAQFLSHKQLSYLEVFAACSHSPRAATIRTRPDMLDRSTPRYTLLEIQP